MNKGSPIDSCYGPLDGFYIFSQAPVTRDPLKEVRYTLASLGCQGDTTRRRHEPRADLTLFRSLATLFMDNVKKQDLTLGLWFVPAVSFVRDYQGEYYAREKEKPKACAFSFILSWKTSSKQAFVISLSTKPILASFVNPKNRAESRLQNLHEADNQMILRRMNQLHT